MSKHKSIGIILEPYEDKLIGDFFKRNSHLKKSGIVKNFLVELASNKIGLTDSKNVSTEFLGHDMTELNSDELSL